jgi:hypothetical protein
MWASNTWLSKIVPWPKVKVNQGTQPEHPRISSILRFQSRLTSLDNKDMTQKITEYLRNVHVSGLIQEEILVHDHELNVADNI